ncbi:acyltransferase family-domain-containing protein [Talaromyces proteolyticus]|uniref:Acyltransferase family-domain-containing protein n=1 Tax=Talaromyces proteolyticus TaxID=1131652 RepID=A0AAD4KDE6_9EURO|nr:acyltransferase family-domain-containing protein [Talaromyces proteolyticus]KAH8689035.1 acyltransferase family-domain-containing protein [Talaromyces proteolyticus]
MADQPYFYTRLWESIPSALPWTSGDPNAKGDPRKTVKWIDGLRGIASIMVVMTHLARSYDYDLFSPRDNPDVPPRLLQQIVLRIPWQGRLGVTIFAFLTGYVCALKPMKLARAGNTNAAFTTIAKSAFRRPPRLMLPATFAMCISWMLAQFGAYTVGNRCDSSWTRDASPDIEDSLYKEIIRLFNAFLIAWTNTDYRIHMVYDEHQWALLPLLKCSMLIFIVCFATALCKYRWRFFICVMLVLYFHQDFKLDRETFQIQALYGMILSDLSYEQRYKDLMQSATWRWPRRIVAWALLAGGLFVCSYPGEHPEWAPWSQRMAEMSPYMFPPGSNWGKRWTAIGIDMIIMSIFLTNWSKEFLSSTVLLWLGKQSFAVYLLHGTLLRTVLVWIIYGISGQPWVFTTDDEGNEIPPPWLPRRAPWVFAVGIPCWLVLLYGCASLWTSYVDPVCAKITAKIEKQFFDEEDEKGPELIPMASRPMPTT